VTMQSAASEAQKGAPGQKPQGGPPKRQLKNFLLLQSFQLKYTAIIVIITSILSAGMGYVIHQRTQEAYAQTRQALKNATDANEQAKIATEQARQASAMLNMEALADPSAGAEAVKKEDEKFAKAAKEMSERAALTQQKAEEMERASHYTIWYLGGLLGFLVLSLGIFGIVITHRVAGPLFVMGRVFHNITQGDYRLQKRALRKGDELAEIFLKGVSAVQALNDQATQELNTLEGSLRLLKKMREGGADPQAISQLEESLRGIAQRRAKAVGQDLSA
jgi:nitrogen fixation/metabolism regulation signal transduction histidine kinase